MKVSSLELRRAQRELEAFCRRRNLQSGEPNAALTCQQEGDDVLLLVHQSLSESMAGDRQVLLRLVRKDAGWQLYWPDARGEWRPWAPLPGAHAIDRIIEELEQAPLHVHW